MNIILTILLTIAGLIALLFILALFTKSRYTIQRVITVNKPKQGVFDYVKLNKNQKQYSKWLSLDPNTKIEYTGTPDGTPDGTPGAILAFESQNNKAGKGEWEVKKVKEGENVEFELRFLAPFVFTANGSFATEAITPDQTKLTWVYNGGMDYPKNIMLLFMNIEKIIGADMAESLQNIKRNLENSGEN